MSSAAAILVYSTSLSSNRQGGEEGLACDCIMDGKLKIQGLFHFAHERRRGTCSDM